MTSALTPAQVAAISALIGQPWEATGLHCWELTRRVQREVFGRELPPVAEAPDAARDIVTIIETHPERARWQRADGPCHGAVVLMSRGRSGHSRDVHIGTYLDLDGGGVLHAAQRYGVAFEPPAILDAAGWRGLTYYTPRD